MTRRNIKVLSVSPYMYEHVEDIKEFLANSNASSIEERQNLFRDIIEPVFNRDGWYLEGDKCWLECDGYAFHSNAESFKYHLELFEAKEFSAEEEELMTKVIVGKLLPKPLLTQMKKILDKSKEKKYVKEIRRDAWRSLT